MSELYKDKIFDIMEDPDIKKSYPGTTYASKRKFLVLVLQRLNELNLLVPEDKEEITSTAELDEQSSGQGIQERE